ncbi:UNVERIFIED_CONTAM: hypothetical protein FKN15_029084 [Acipenser sinensis]
MYPVKKVKIKILGLIFENCPGAQSWTVVINQVRKKIGGWSTRSLTMTGRVLITKSILFPIRSYVGKIFPPDRTTKKVVEHITHRFIWSSKMERVKRATMSKADKKGCKGVLDVVQLTRVQGLTQTIKNIQTLNRKVDRELSDTYPVKKDKIKILGLIFENNCSGAQSWTVAINQVRKKIGGWSTRSLTMTGRVLITKSILFPILSYVGKIFPPDRTTKTVVDHIIHRFIWGSKMEKAKQATMSKADKKGGKGVPDVVQLTRVQGLTQTIKNIQSLDRKEIEKVATFSLTQSQKICENVSHSCLSNVQKDIAWNTVHSSLPTRAVMFRRGLAQVETCPYAKCRKRETPAHIFWECDVAGSVWLSVCVFLNKFADTTKMTAETVLYGPAGGITTSTAKCVWRVINVVKQILWEGRNICVYHKQ